MSFQSAAELRYGARLARWGERRRARLEAFLGDLVVVYPTDATVHRWARLRAEVMHGGRHLAPADAWVAATALELGVPLLTHNWKDFGAVKGLTVISENR